MKQCEKQVSIIGANLSLLLWRTSVNSNCGNKIWKYAYFMVFNNLIILYEGEDTGEAFKLCNDPKDLVIVRNKRQFLISQFCYHLTQILNLILLKVSLCPFALSVPSSQGNMLILSA